MINKEIEKMLNDQLNFEYHSAWIYRKMSYYLHRIYPGAEHWMNMQRDEEELHAQRIFDFMDSVDIFPTLETLDDPINVLTSLLDVFQSALDHEIKVTKRIHDLVTFSLTKNEHRVNQFLQWFVTEQIKKEATLRGIIEKIKFINGDPVGILQMDEILGSRLPAAMEK